MAEVPIRNSNKDRRDVNTSGGEVCLSVRLCVCMHIWKIRFGEYRQGQEQGHIFWIRQCLIKKNLSTADISLEMGFSTMEAAFLVYPIRLKLRQSKSFNAIEPPALFVSLTCGSSWLGNRPSTNILQYILRFKSSWAWTTHTVPLFAKQLQTVNKKQTGISVIQSLVTCIFITIMRHWS